MVWILRAAALAPLLGAAMPALATPFSQTYSGTVLSGTDAGGVFGPGGADLAGSFFTAVYTFDPAAFGTASTSTTAISDNAYGGSAYGTSSPLAGVTFTIGGVSVSIDPSTIGQLYASTTQFYAYAADAAGNYFESFLDDPGLSMTPVLGLAQSYASRTDLDNAEGSGFSFGGDMLSLASTALDIGAITKTPEPASFALLAAGLLAAAFLCRPRPATAAA